MAETRYAHKLRDRQRAHGVHSSKSRGKYLRDTKRTKKPAKQLRW